MHLVKFLFICIFLIYSLPCYPQLFGSKTIGGTSPDYASFSDAISDLTSVGVSGAVIFSVRTGNYPEQISIPQITGASSSNTITFTSGSGDSSDVILTYSPGSSLNNYTIQLDGADHIVFSNITISSTGTDYSRVVLVKGITEDIKFLNNQFIGTQTTGSSVENAVYYASSGLSTADIDYVFDQNLFQFGSYGIYHHGPSANPETGTVIKNNTFLDQYSYGIFLFGQEAPLVENNSLTTGSQNSGYIGIECRFGSENIRILKNLIMGAGMAGGTGINFTYSDGSSGNEAIVANNTISLNTLGNSCRPIAASYSSYLKLFYNSTHISGNYSFSSCFEAGFDLINTELKNNIFTNQASGYAIFSYVTSGITSDFNDLLSNGTNLGYWNGNVTDLGSWQTVSSQDGNSISADPMFFSSSDLHAANILLKSGTPVSLYITDDFEGDPRDGSAPCMGADEFVIPALTGTYTIGTASSDFTSFNAAVNDLILGGVRGPVIFNVKSETFNEQITLPEIKNASKNNTITFQSESGDSTSAIITFQPTNSGNNYTIKFDGAAHFRIKSLTISTTGSEYATAVKMVGGSSDIYFNNNQIFGVHPPTILEGELIQGSTDLIGDNFLFHNNLIKDGAYGIYISGELSDHSINLSIQNNHCIDQDRIGIYIAAFDTVSIHNNLFSTVDEDYYYGIYCNVCNNSFEISNNSIITTNTTSGYGIYIANSNGSGSDIGLISNNNIWLNSKPSGLFSDGIYFENSSYQNFLFNTIVITGNLSFSKSVQLGPGISQIILNNNILANFAQGYASFNTGNSGVTSDYNDLYTNGGFLGSWNAVNQSDLDAWQIACGLDPNSLSVDPEFLAALDPHFPNTLLNDAGTPLAVVTDDIDGEMRDPVNPDIGADEFCMPPVADDKTGCTTRSIPDLTATGNNINWYSDGTLTTLIHSGNSFATGQTDAGTYTYYATQTINESESQADTVILTINTTPGIPPASDDTICFGEITPDLTAAGTDLKWYDDEALTNQVHTGSPFPTGVTDPGSYAYYVTQTLDGCESDPDTSMLIIHSIPAAPGSEWFISCFGEIVPDLTATGQYIQWYSDESLTSLVHTGSTYSSGDTLAGRYAYFPTQTVNGCESGSAYDTLWIKPRPEVPFSDSQSVCIGQSVPDLTASGTDIKWYQNAERLSLLHSGNTYSTGNTDIGIYPYFVTQTVDGCESLNKQVALAINGLPVPLVLAEQVICEVDTQDFHLGTTANPSHSYSWTSSQGDLTSTEADPVVRPSVPGTFKYFLTETIDSTGCNKFDSVTIVINPNPVVNITAGQNPIEKDSSTLLNASGANTYQWNPATGLSGTTGSQVTASPKVNSTYFLVGTNQYGCTGNDTIDLFVYCPACSQETYFTATGTFNFGCTDNLYRNNLNCSWTLLPSGVSNLYLQFSGDFDIKSGDWVWVYDGQDITADTIGRYNNDKLPPDQIIGGSALHIRFTTDDTISGLGFTAQWSNEPVTGTALRPEKIFRIYPNPAENILNIEWFATSSEYVYISIYNNLGQLVLNRKVPIQPGSVMEEISLHSLRPGIYHVQVNSEDKIERRKIIKQ